MRTYVYVDGFNLYYRALKGTSYKWLDLYKLAERALPRGSTVERINYYTAHVSGALRADAPRNQQLYLNALKTIPCVRIHTGKFLTSEPFMPLYQPLTFRPQVHLPAPHPRSVKVVKTEEKGTDVNLGVHLVRDAFQKAFEQAAVITNDTDLAEAIRIVKEEVGLPVVLLAPTPKPSHHLEKFSTEVRHIRRYLPQCQFPDPVTSPGGRTTSKPSSW